MKSIITLILVFSSSFIFSQNIDPNTGSSRLGNLSNMSNFSGGSIVFNKKSEIKGNIHLFEKWSNTGVINIDGKNYKLLNINYNMRTDNFESQVGKDSVFILDNSNVNHLYINNKRFENFYFSRINKNKNFEVIHDGKEFKLIKGFEIGVKYGETDPLMVKKKVDKYFTTKSYYLMRGIDINDIGLKKKVILTLFKDKKDLVGKFVKENKLSYKKDADLKKIFKYYDSL